ncbi:MAG: DUF1573 domain-containing protein [Lewinellaceae bacterium]|nr:DUF1573 domain-containing protein [Lewinellaceae bacterium]
MAKKNRDVSAAVIILGLLGVGLISCQQSAGSATGPERSVEEITDQELLRNSSIIRNPISAKGIDTSQLARIVFTETLYDFGTVDEGEIIKHVFAFTNTGNVPLVISSATSTCGCTVADWPKEPILPGESSEIVVEFDTLHKENQQSKPITITANTYPSETRIYMRGFVTPNPNDENG